MKKGITKLKRNLAMLLGLLLAVTALPFADVLPVKAVDNINVTVSGVADVSFIPTSGQSGQETVHVGSSGPVSLVNGTYSIEVAAEFTMDFTTLKIGINGAETDYSTQAANKDIYTISGVTIGDDTQSISVTATTHQTTKRTIIWTYDPSEDEDGEMLVEHGTVQMISGATDFNSNERFKHYVANEGDTVTLKLIPDAGYQVSGASINGTAIAADDGTQSQFTFTIGSGHVRFKGAFTKVSTQAAVKSSANVSALTASVPDANVTTGSVAVIATGGQSNPPDSAIQAAMGSDSGDFVEAVETLDIGLTNIVSKGGSGDYASVASNYWNAGAMTNLTGGDASLYLSVSSSGLDDGETYGIIKDHGGTKTEIDAVYNSTSGQLRFTSSEFSNYTIIKKKGTPETTPDTSYEEAKATQTSNAEESTKEETPDFTEVLKSFDGAASGLNFDNSASSQDGKNHKVTVNVTFTSDAGVSSATKAVMPTGFKGAFGFDIMVDGQPATGNKTGELIVNIPRYYQRNNRVFGLLITEPDGSVKTYFDEGLDAATFTANINTNGYSCAMICIDTALNLQSASGISGGRAYVVGQGPMWRAAVKLGMPIGYRPLLSFNLTGASGGLKSAPGTISIEIPTWALRTGRTYALIGVDLTGIPHVYRDTDRSAGTLTADVGDVVTSYALIYRD